jgi:hypothetical protein
MPATSTVGQVWQQPGRISTHVPTRSFSQAKNLASCDDGSSVIAELTLPKGATAGMGCSLSRGEGGGAMHSLPLCMVAFQVGLPRLTSSSETTCKKRSCQASQTDRQPDSIRFARGLGDLLALVTPAEAKVGSSRGTFPVERRRGGSSSKGRPKFGRRN